MFSIIISEKGGAERKETFDKNEINVGRVQGNDLMLPKGNVSKHHARLLYRDGRFIVTDLKSTNGTYVNGRKIAQATIVREGDKIYIGDFVLRLDAGGGEGAQPSPDDESVRTLARGNNPPPAQAPPAQAAPPPAQAAPPQQSQQPAPRQQPMMGQPAPSPVAPYAERDQEDEPPPPPPKPAPAAPRPQPAGAPGGASASPLARGNTLQMSGNQRPATAVSARPQAPGAAAGGAAPAPAPAPVVNMTVPSVAATAPAAQAAAVNLPPPVVLPVAPPRVVPRETQAQAGRRLALLTLVDRISDAVDLAALKTSPIVDDTLAQHIDRTAREQAGSMRDDGESPEGVDLDQLATDAVRELVGLGALGALLDDDEVTEIQCVRNDQLLAVRGGQIALADAAFTSDEALGRAIARLAHQSGEPLRAGEAVIERRLARGAHLLAVAPPAAAGHAFVIRKRRRIDATLEDLVRSGTLSRPMAVFLDGCVQARANVIASAPASTSTAQLVAALASAAPPGERVALLSDVEEVAVGQALVFSLSLSDRRASACEEVVRAAARLHPDRLIASSLPTGAAAPLLEAIAEGAEGVIAAGSAPSLRHLLARFTSQIVLSRPGLDAAAARDCIADAFDVAIEMTTLADGRSRILRIAEVGAGENRAPRDLFVFAAETSGEGTFQGTGNVPSRLINDFAARGVKLEASLFKRGR